MCAWAHWIHLRDQLILECVYLAKQSSHARKTPWVCFVYQWCSVFSHSVINGIRHFAFIIINKRYVYALYAQRAGIDDLDDRPWTTINKPADKISTVINTIAAVYTNNISFLLSFHSLWIFFFRFLFVFRINMNKIQYIQFGIFVCARAREKNGYEQTKRSKAIYCCRPSAS